MKFLSVLALTFYFSGTASAFSGDEEVKINFDKPKCLQGSMSMDIEVTVKKETFKFSPSCSFSFSNDFKTKDGTKCSIKAGMCSSFSPKERFEVECDKLKKATVGIPCKGK